MTLTSQAKELAKQLLQAGKDEDYILTHLQEEIDCSKTTAWRGLKRAKIELEQGLKKPVEPSREITEEPEKTPAFIPEGDAEPIAPQPLEEIAAPEPTREVPPEQAEEIETFRDMLRGTHILFFSKDGLLGDKYGHTDAVCVQTSDQLYRWLTRRYGVEDLERFDTVLLFMAYGTLIGKPVLTFVRERQRQSEKKKSD